MHAEHERTEPYDAVIIGSGIGGLTCATYLARRGLRVLVCEKEGTPGGLMSSFRRKGFVFDLALPSIGSAGLVFHVLDDLGVRSELDLLESPFRLVAPHFDFIPRSTRDTVSELSRAFPEEKAGIRAYFALLQRISQEICGATSKENPLLKEGRERLLAFLPFLFDSRALFLDYFRHRNLPAERKIRDLIHNEDLRNFLITVGFPRKKGVILDALVWNSLIEDSYYPLGGTGRIPSLLAGLVERYGGRVLLGTRVDRIRVERGRAAGVVLADGTEIPARFVVSNADYKATFLSLLPPGAVPERFLARVRAAPVCESLFTAYLGVDIPPEEIGLGAPHCLHFPTYMYVDFDRTAQDEAYFQKAWQCISVPSLLDPGLAPKGKSVVILRTWTTAGYQGGWKGAAEAGESSQDARKLRESIGREVIASAERVLPGLAARIEHCEYATPVTYALTTGNSEGALSGWSVDPDHPFYRDVFRQVQGFLSPLPYLLMVGHWTAHPGGLPVAMGSGRCVADSISSFLGGDTILHRVPSPLRAPAERTLEKALAFLSSWK